MGFEIQRGGPSVQETLDAAKAGNEGAILALEAMRLRIARDFAALARSYAHGRED
jgi:hypothetical protein